MTDLLTSLTTSRASEARPLRRDPFHVLSWCVHAYPDAVEWVHKMSNWPLEKAQHEFLCRLIECPHPPEQNLFVPPFYLPSMVDFACANVLDGLLLDRTLLPSCTTEDDLKAIAVLRRMRAHISPALLDNIPPATILGGLLSRRVLPAVISELSLARERLATARVPVDQEAESIRVRLARFAHIGGHDGLPESPEGFMSLYRSSNLTVRRMREQLWIRYRQQVVDETQCIEQRCQTWFNKLFADALAVGDTVALPLRRKDRMRRCGRIVKIVPSWWRETRLYVETTGEDKATIAKTGLADVELVASQLVTQLFLIWCGIENPFIPEVRFVRLGNNVLERQAARVMRSTIVEERIGTMVLRRPDGAVWHLSSNQVRPLKLVLESPERQASALTSWLTFVRHACLQHLRSRFLFRHKLTEDDCRQLNEMRIVNGMALEYKEIDEHLEAMRNIVNSLETKVATMQQLVALTTLDVPVGAETDSPHKMHSAGSALSEPARSSP